MKAAVFGTSNGIISDGYLAALKSHPDVEKVLNLSLGASPIDFFIYRIFAAPLEGVDFAILESAVNDAACCRAGAYTVERMKDVLAFAVDTLISRGVEPIGFIVPPRNLDEHTQGVIAGQREVFDRAGIRYFDGFEAFTQEAERLGVEYADLFRDAAHPLSEVVNRLSATYLATINQAEAPKRDPMAEYGFEYRPIGAGSVSIRAKELERRDFTTALVKGTLFTVPDGDGIELQVENGEELVGLVLNIRATSSFLKLEGESQMFKDGRFEIDPEDTKLVVSPLRAGLTGRAGKVVLNAERNPPEVVEPSYFGAKEDEARGGIEISGYVVRQALSS